MNTLLDDFRYGLRTLLKHKRFSILVILTLALGMGANTAVFSVVNAVILRPLPFPDPDRLMTIWETMPGNDRRLVAPGNFDDWRKQNRSFEKVAAFVNTSLNLSGRDDPQKLVAASVSTDFFSALGVQPGKGRTFIPEDVSRDNGVVILSARLWQTRFASAPDILGQTLTLNEGKYTVVGIMPADFKFPPSAELWVLGQEGGPMPVSSLRESEDVGANSERDIHICHAFGRLKPSVTREQAQAEMQGIAQRLALEYPKTNDGLGAHVIPLHEQIVGSSRAMLFTLLGAVVLVLLIACANVSNLLLVRVARREREIAIRLAVGAGRLRLIRQLLVESLLLSVIGGGIGILIAVWGIHFFVTLGPANIPRLDEVHLDGRLLIFAGLVSLVTGVAFGCIPALQATRFDPQNALQQGGRGSSEGRVGRRAQDHFVIAEIAIALVLLIGAGLLIASFVRLQVVEIGFNAARLLTGRVSLTSSHYSSAKSRTIFYDRLLERLEGIAGVRSAALVMALPLSGETMNRGFEIEGRPAPKANENISVNYQLISPRYFATMEIPLLAGRGFSETDGETAPRVLIISQLMARKYFGGENPIGKRVALGDSSNPESWRTIVGVVGDTRDENMETPPFPTAYAPYRQNSEPWSQMAIVLRTETTPAALFRTVRQEVFAIDPGQPITHLQSMEDLMASGVTRPRFAMLLIGSLAGIAFILTTVGIYGVVAYSVAHRTHEIGIRMALGAQKGDVLWLVIKQGMILTLIGVALGLAGAFGLTRLIASLLFAVAATDPLTFIAIPLLLLFVALIACYLPARRAARLDPKIALAQS